MIILTFKQEQSEENYMSNIEVSRSIHEETMGEYVRIFVDFLKGISFTDETIRHYIKTEKLE